jgi:hypothetical protein
MKEVCIRQGRPSDARALVQLLASQRMATDIDPVDFIVAEVDCRLLGAARLEWAGTDDAFLRPVVVATEARDGPRTRFTGKTLWCLLQDQCRRPGGCRSVLSAFGVHGHGLVLGPQSIQGRMRVLR